MTTTPESDGPRPWILQDLIQESGHTEDKRVATFTRLATAVQHDRHARRVSDTENITRSTGLWTLMELDPDVRAALERGGVQHSKLSRTLSLRGTPAPVRTDRAVLHEDFGRAVQMYLVGRPLQPPIDLMDLTAAIIRAGRFQPGGLLPKRLGDMSIDYDVVLSEVDRYHTGTPPRSAGSGNPPPLSETMQDVARHFSAGDTSSVAGTDISAFEIARAIQLRHPEYAEGRLVLESIPEAGAFHSWNDWLDLVARQYDREAVAQSRHEVLDGRLFLVGLALIDPAMRELLEEGESFVPLLLEVDESAAPPGTPLWRVLQEVQLGYGYQSDEASGEDQLGIEGEVNAVCAVITDRAVKPPLAVGLFGEWGTGKSFFMGKMRERIAQLTSTSGRQTGDGPKPLNVIQIRFNAWHYSDSSLWASMAIEIFERLADPEPISTEGRAKWLRDHGDDKRAEREALLAELETYRGAKAALDVERGQLQARRAAIDASREEAARRRREAVEKASLVDVAGALAEDQQVQSALREISDRLNITPAVGELMGLAKVLRTTGGFLPMVWRLVQHKTQTVALAATFMVLCLATAALVLRSGWGWVGSLATAAGSVGAAVVTASKYINPAAEQVNNGLAAVESAIATAAAVEASLRTRRDQQERELELELAGIDDEIAQASQAIAALDEQIAATQASADALTVGRRLYDFLADRAAGYQKHQGVVGMLHRDFRLLDAQLLAYEDVRDNDTAGQDAVGKVTGWPAADRVVLYIDDLDRCAPAKVLEVLEAVHLLLALELFVVVVGVDPRWLQRSLRHQYRDLVTSGDPRTDPYLRAMPIEYLEKIFQIPLTLPAMEPEGYARLIGSLAPTFSPRAPAEAEQTAPATRPRASTTESPGGDRAPTRALMDVEVGSAASGSHGESIDLTEAEVEFAQKLGALVDSPRAAKRFMNTYRLIRATRHVGSRSRFLGNDGKPGEYRAVLTLLAVAAGHPTMADRLLVALQDATAQPTISTWSTFVAALNPGTGNGGRGALAPTDLGRGDDAVGDESASWAALFEALEGCVDHDGPSDIEPYQRWGKIVARFSFTL